MVFHLSPFNHFSSNRSAFLPLLCYQVVSIFYFPNKGGNIVMKMVDSFHTRLILFNDKISGMLCIVVHFFEGYRNYLNGI